jgi:sugar lactone lactonase YvrE
VDQSFITGSHSLGAVQGVAVDAGHVYWAIVFAGTIGRANLDGTGVDEFFIPAATESFLLPVGVAVDASYIYWASDGPLNTIGRANLDGTGVDHIFITFADQTVVDGVAVDAGHLYWANQDTNTIGRANLDGTGVDQSFITGASDPAGIAVDAG